VYALSVRLAEESSGGVLGDCLDALLDVTSARCALAFGSDGSLEPAAERRLTLRPNVDIPKLRRAARTLAERAATARRVVLVNDVRREVATIPDAPEITALGVRAVLAEPVVHRRVILATLVLMFDDPAMLDDETTQFVTTVTSIAAVALERDRHVEEAATDRSRLVTGAGNAGVGLVTATVAHELKSPIGALALQYEELARLTDQFEKLGGSSDTALGGVVAELSELTSDMHITIGRVRETVENLTTLGRKDAARRQLDLGIVARETVIVARPHLERLGIVLHERYQADCYSLGRKDALGQVILNLIFNAADACTGGSQPQIWVRVAADGPHVLLIVQDNGPGVPQAAVESIFLPFYTTKKKGEAVGLGLKICSDVVADHGGHIEVHERPGGGAAFHVLLPRVDDLGTPASVASPLQAQGPRGETRSILVIEDDPILARTLRRVLRPHEVRTAATASEAEILLLDPEYAPDLVVCDVYLPGANGNVLHERIRRARPNTADRFVFITGGALGQAEADYIKTCRRPTLQKPLDLQSLLLLLEPTDRRDSNPPASVRTLSEQGVSERATLPPNLESD
jgi:signal transduction histidine kinase/ActR/RegA family two-component response regulator